MHPDRDRRRAALPARSPEHRLRRRPRPPERLRESRADARGLCAASRSTHFAHAADYRESGQLRPVRGIGMATLLAPGGCARRADGRTAVDDADRGAPRGPVVSPAPGSRLSPEVRQPGLGRGGVLLPDARLLQPGLPRASRRAAHRRRASSHGDAGVVARSRSPSDRPPLPCSSGCTSASFPLSLGVLLGLVDRRVPCPSGSARSRDRERAARQRSGGAAESRSANRPGPDDGLAHRRPLPLVVPYVAGHRARSPRVSLSLGTGSAHPTAPYAPFSDTTVGRRPGRLPRTSTLSTTSSIRSTGWIPYVPVHWLGLAALGCLVLKLAVASGSRCIAVAVGYELVLASAGGRRGMGSSRRGT